MAESRRLTADMFSADVMTSILDRRVVVDRGCWIFTGAPNDSGYGIINVGGRVERIHRVVYAALRGPVPAGICVLHSCDTPPCFCPHHLFLGTRHDNTEDMIRKNRWRKPRYHVGEASALARLTEPDVLSAIDRLLAGETRTSIAADLGVTLGAISRIAVGKNWKHLTAGRGITKSTRGVRRCDVRND